MPLIAFSEVAITSTSGAPVSLKYTHSISSKFSCEEDFLILYRTRMFSISLVFIVVLISIAVAGFSIETSLVTYLAIEELFLDCVSAIKSTPSLYVTLETSMNSCSSAG